LTFWHARRSNTVAIADIAKAKTFRLSFRKYFAAFASFRIFGLPRKGWWVLFDKRAQDINMAKVYRILEGPIALLPCASHNFYEK
jgi:hypothetical protein